MPMIETDFRWAIAKGIARTMHQRFLPCFIYSRRTQMAETLDKAPQAEAPNNDAQLDQQSVALNGPSGRRLAHSMRQTVGRVARRYSVLLLVVLCRVFQPSVFASNR